ncbi:MAG TPA: rod shape-determining protein MreC [Syntrophomonadaceae bacterium]|nr:rod shape-determining protein MreC [Syntrophomonadaceae bacterium]
MFKLLKNKYLWIALLIFFISMFVINLTSESRDDITILEKVIRDTYTPLQIGVNEFRDNWGGMGTIFANTKNLQNQIVELEEKNRELRFQNQSLREFKSEAKRLQKILNFKDHNIEKYDLQSAKVIARSPNNWYRNITIDQGASSGIVKGMPVMNQDGLIGRVRSVSQNSAQVALITDREMAVGVTIQQNRDTNGILEGLGDNNDLRMINIPYYSTIKPNDIVISSGLSQTYPPGIDIGVVSTVTQEPNGLLLSATIKPVVNFDRLEEVLVITDYRPTVFEDDFEGDEVEE